MITQDESCRLGQLIDIQEAADTRNYDQLLNLVQTTGVSTETITPPPYLPACNNQDRLKCLAVLLAYGYHKHAPDNHPDTEYSWAHACDYEEDPSLLKREQYYAHDFVFQHALQIVAKHPYALTEYQKNSFGRLIFEAAQQICPSNALGQALELQHYDIASKFLEITPTWWFPSCEQEYLRYCTSVNRAHKNASYGRPSQILEILIMHRSPNNFTITPRTLEQINQTKLICAYYTCNVSLLLRQGSRRSIMSIDWGIHTAVDSWHDFYKKTKLEVALQQSTYNPHEPSPAKEWLEKGANPNHRVRGPMVDYQTIDYVIGNYPKDLSAKQLETIGYLWAYNQKAIERNPNFYTQEQQLSDVHKSIAAQYALEVLAACPHHWTTLQRQSAQNLLTHYKYHVENPPTDRPWCVNSAITARNYDHATFFLEHLDTVPLNHAYRCAANIVQYIQLSREVSSVESELAMLAILAKKCPQILEIYTENNIWTLLTVEEYTTFTLLKDHI